MGNSDGFEFKEGTFLVVGDSDSIYFGGGPY